MLSLIIPAYNEQEVIEGVVREAHDALSRLGRDFEILIINDGSEDGTREILLGLAKELKGLRIITLSPRSGQSSAMGVGFDACTGDIVVVMDADGQNDPGDIERLVDQLEKSDVCCGYRAKRRDTLSKKLGSRLANRIRNAVLGESIIDTGCSLKAFKVRYVKGLSMWHGMHRFLPSLTRMAGARINQIPVNHRPRKAGRSKYTNLGRLRETVWDLWAVRWMKKRTRRFEVRIEDVSSA